MKKYFALCALFLLVFFGLKLSARVAKHLVNAKWPYTYNVIVCGIFWENLGTDVLVMEFKYLDGTTVLMTNNGGVIHGIDSKGDGIFLEVKYK